MCKKHSKTKNPYDCWLPTRTRALQSTYSTHCICRAAGAAVIYMYMFVDDLYLRMLGQLCAWSSAVGMVDRHCQQNTIFVTLVGCAKGIEAYWTVKPVFHQFQWLTCCSDAARSRDVAIFMLKMMTDDRQNRLFYPLHTCVGYEKHWSAKHSAQMWQYNNYAY